ncbi:MAG: hypothetical protein WCP57_01005 [Bacteroidota bacterium]
MHTSIIYALPIQYDSSKISWRAFDNKKIESLQKDKKYDYGKSPSSVNASKHKFLRFLERAIEKLFILLFSNWKGLSVIATVIRILIYIAFFSFILYVIFQVFNLRQVFSSRKTSIHLPYDIEKEDIQELDFNYLIQEAIKNKQYRLAVRLQYLNTLKKLNENNYIQWSIEKTNWQYMFELKEPYKSKFVQITTVFDWVWYGEHSIDEQEYSQIEKQFSNYNKSIF